MDRWPTHADSGGMGLLGHHGLRTKSPPRALQRNGRILERREPDLLLPQMHRKAGRGPNPNTARMEMLRQTEGRVLGRVWVNAVVADGVGTSSLNPCCRGRKG